MTDAVTLTTPPRSADRPEYEEAAEWAMEVQGTLRASRRAAWLVAGAAAAAALLLGTALATLGPLRTAAPYSVLVERQSGHGQTVRRLAPGPLVRDPAIIDSLLARYVMAREGFDATDLQADYRLVALWSDAATLTRYGGEITRGNPASPVAVYAATTTITPVVKSVSRLSPTQALVRFDTVRRDVGVLAGEQRGWQASVTFGFRDEPMRNAERFENPLGFRVTEYRRDPDGTLPSQFGFTAP